MTLKNEGQFMHNCVSSYSYLLKERSSNFLYQTFNPQRGTLQVELKNKKFHIIQFKLVCNRQPSKEAFFAVRQWLDENEVGY
jgi:hypothetical protein